MPVWQTVHRIRNENSAWRGSFWPDIPADIRPKTSVRPSKCWKNKHSGTDIPCGRPWKNFGLKNFGLIFVPYRKPTFGVTTLSYFPRTAVKGTPWSTAWVEAGPNNYVMIKHPHWSERPATDSEAKKLSWMLIYSSSRLSKSWKTSDTKSLLMKTYSETSILHFLANLTCTVWPEILHYSNIFFLELMSALHYIICTAKISGWSNVALHCIILTATLRLHLVFVFLTSQ